MSVVVAALGLGILASHHHARVDKKEQHTPTLSVGRKHRHDSSYPDYWRTGIGIGMLEDARLVTGPTKFDMPPPPFLLPPPPLPSHSNECHFDSCDTSVGYHYLHLMSAVVVALGLGILASRTTIWRRRRLRTTEPSMRLSALALPSNSTTVHISQMPAAQR